MTVRSGLDALIDSGYAPLRGKRVGVLTHPASVDRSYVHLLDRFADDNASVEQLFHRQHLAQVLV